jgi:peptidoglycan-associated lipoprotein
MHRWLLAPLAVLVVLLPVAGCAKRPALTQASAPPPTGAVATPPSPPPVARQEPAPTPLPLAPAPAPAPEPTPAPAPPPTAAPVPAKPQPAEFTAVAAMRDIHFDFDKSEIRPEAARILDANADWLRSNADHIVLIEGHCDERGTNEYNLALGERRARAAMDYLTSKGIAGSRLQIISYGEERPLCTDHNEGCWARNRRDHFLVKAR